MEPHVVFLANNNCHDVIDAHSSKCIIDTIQKVKLREEECNPPLSTVGCVRSAQICGCTELDTKAHSVWYELDATKNQSAVEEYFSHTCNDQLIDKEKSTFWSECLHELASKLTDNGVVLDILWPFDIAKYLTLSEHLELFGALKRLVEWHRGVVYFLITEAEDVKNVYACIKEWVDLLQGVIISTSDLLTHKRACHWRGYMDITGSQATKSLELNGLSLEEYIPNDQQFALKFHTDNVKENKEKVKNRLTEGRIEFVTAVPFTQVPSFFITHHTYRLSIKSQSDHLSKSRRFFHRLQEDTSVAYILRLRYGSDWSGAADSKMHKSRGNQQKRQKQWQEMIIDSIANVTESRTRCQVSGRIGVYQFLVRSDPSSLSTSPTVLAHLMRDMSEFDGRVSMMISLNHLQHGQQLEVEMESWIAGRRQAEDLIKSLPHFTAQSILQLERDVEKVQLEVIQTWIEIAQENGKDSKLSLEDLLFLLRAARKSACEKLLESERYHSDVQPLEDPWSISKPKPEYELDASTHLESVALSLRSSSHASSLSKLNSSENLGGLAPPTGQILTLDAGEFLKHFNTDGTALKTDGVVLRPERSPSRRFQKKGSRDLKTSHWPECLRAKDHDVYYNCEETERMEKRCERVRSRLLPIETSSTCTLQQARSPPPITIIDTSSNQSMPSPASTSLPMKTDQQETKQVTPETSGQRKKRRRESDASLEPESKRIQMARPEREEEKVEHRNPEVENREKCMKSEKESRSQRHKRKLQEVVHKTLASHGMVKEDPLYTSCVKKLFTLTMCFAKDLKTSHNLREEMAKIAAMHVEQVIQFEKRMKKESKDSA